MRNFKIYCLSNFWVWGGTHKNLEFIYKKQCIYSYIIKLQSLSKYSPFFHCSKQFWTCWFWCLLVLRPLFVSPLPHQQNIFLWGLFSSKETKNSCLGWNLVYGGAGHNGHAIFGQKLLNTLHSVGRCAQKSPIRKWANALSLQKNSRKPNTASHNNTSRYSDTDGFLEHSPSRGSLYYKGHALQKIIPGFGGPYSYIIQYCYL